MALKINQSVGDVAEPAGHDAEGRQVDSLCSRVAEVSRLRFLNVAKNGVSVS